MDTDVPSISPAELLGLMGRADAPLLLDVRRRERFAASERLLPGALYCAPDEVAAFAAREAPREVVVSCVYGHNVSEDVTRTLRAAGWPARRLAGGIEGGEPGVDAPQDLARWRQAPVPRIRKRPDLGVTGERPSRWITLARPKVERIACPWLILRFIDVRAQFFYVPDEEVFTQAASLEAVPYDIEGASITHQWERCSFDALIAAFDLHDPALEAMATIVRGADTSRPAIAPQAAGLLAIALGYSRLHAQDDTAMLHAMLPVYDALYAWCRDGQAETHTWTTHADKP